MEKVRWGFIGAGMIAKKALWPALLKSEVAEIYAVAAKDAERAKALSPSGRIYTAYEDLLADPNIEAPTQHRKIAHGIDCNARHSRQQNSHQ